jgi:hypothetical protein
MQSIEPQNFDLDTHSETTKIAEIGTGIRTDRTVFSLPFPPLHGVPHQVNQSGRQDHGTLSGEGADHRKPSENENSERKTETSKH